MLLHHHIPPCDQPADDSTPHEAVAISEHLRHLLCVMRGGHDLMLHGAPTRLYLECASCGYQSPGWVIAADHADHGTHAGGHHDHDDGDEALDDRGGAAGPGDRA